MNHVELDQIYVEHRSNQGLLKCSAMLKLRLCSAVKFTNITSALTAFSWAGEDFRYWVRLPPVSLTVLVAVTWPGVFT